ncbi:PepSY domain-containing protein [Oceanobacter sp. 3_MG-2023]|uniref:PepSY-associated TM helix domain-containing protein n=1 Tax=Oceanobacter sp. 3_MG-2023 TaxID=3062622 RepID=UPI002734901D|nr:PepSY-associated TM helix domain-containing protein [Oceanobacter sp. 3_MG-2023]MDP2506042.1 PepSY-associated TM helix domain-containing protein [Oceanobacter sp. 3_MG-2023]
MKNGFKVRGDILKMYKTLHTWVGISSGILLFICFFAGALTMFEEPIQQWSEAASDKLQPTSQLSPVELDSLVDQVLAQYPAAHRGMTLQLGEHPQGNAPLFWQGGGRSRDLNLSAARWQASLDNDGQLQVQQQTPGQLGELIDLLHRTAGIPGQWGHGWIGLYLMGVASLLYCLALVSGIVLVLPTLIRDFLIVRPEKSRKRFWLDSHNLIGITSLPFHLMIAVTVVVFAFHDELYDALQEVVYGDKSMFGVRVEATEQSVTELPAISQLLEQVQQQAPGFEVKAVELMNLDSSRAIARVAVTHDSYLTRGAREGYVILDPYTLEVINTSVLPGQQDDWSMLVSSFFGMHFGSFGGTGVKWLYFALGLSGAFIFYSGNVLWIQSRRKKSGKAALAMAEQPRSVRWMANATTGVCLGSIAGVAVAMAVSKLSEGMLVENSEGNPSNILLLWGYYLTWLVWLLWACVRGSERAGSELLQATAVSVLLIPACSMLLVLSGDLDIAAVTGASLAVDLVALLSTGLILLLDWRLRRRAVPVGAALADAVTS